MAYFYRRRRGTRYGPGSSRKRQDHARRSSEGTVIAGRPQLARRFGIDRKTVRKWRSRSSTCDLPMGPKQRRAPSCRNGGGGRGSRPGADATALGRPLRVMRDAIPHLSRGTLHRALQRHGVSRLPQPPRERSSGSKPTRSATSTSTLPSYDTQGVRPTFSWRSR